MQQNKNTNIISYSDVIWLINAILKNWYLYLILIPVFLVLGYIYNYKQKLYYHTKIEILLKSNDVYDYQESLQSSLGFYNYYGDISNQKRIFGSYDLMRNVVRKIDLSCSYYIVGRLNTKEFFNELPFKIKVNILNPNILETPIKFKILNEEKYSLNYSIGEVLYDEEHYFDSIQTNNNYSIETKLFSKSASNLSEIHYEIVFHDENYWINHIVSNLNIENIEFTSLLVVNLLDEIP